MLVAPGLELWLEQPVSAVPWGLAAVEAGASRGWSWVQAGQALCAMAKAQLPRKLGGMEYLLPVRQPSAELLLQRPCSRASTSNG